jgi:hypothetical protein
MPKFACQCGNVLNLSPVWPDCEWLLVPIQRVSDISDAMATEARPTGEQMWESMNEVGITVYRCSVCDRLHLEHERNRFTSYVREHPPLKTAAGDSAREVAAASPPPRR